MKSLRQMISYKAMQRCEKPNQSGTEEIKGVLGVQNTGSDTGVSCCHII